MKLEMVLNELSINNPSNSEQIARELMYDLIKTIATANNQGIGILRTKSKIYDIIIAQNYPISKWLHDNLVSTEQKDFLLTIETQTPLLKEITDKLIINKANWSYSILRGEEDTATELTIAYLLDALAISFNTQDKWKNTHLELEITTLDESQKWITRQVTVFNASCPSHVQEHSQWIKDRIRFSVKHGKELWNRKEELFPNLEFCNSVKKQLEDILSGQLELQPVVRTLLTLQNYCHTWNSGNFNIESSILEYSPESPQTLNNPKYKKQREFICPDGETQLFSLHAKLRKCNWRIYFKPEQPGKVIIGYIGRHLSTVNYKK